MNKPVRRLLVLVLPALLLLAAPFAGASVQVVNGDFETGNLSQWGGRQTPKALGTGTSDITVVRSPVKQGVYSARIATTTPEQTGSQVGSSRAELTRSSASTGNTGFPAREGAELWSRWSIYVPATTARSHIPTGGDGMVIQQQASSGNGVFELNGLLELRSNMTLVYNDGDSGAHEGTFWRSAQLAPDRWYTIMIHKRYSKTVTGGFVEIYLNGVRQSLCANATCTTKTSRIVQRNLHPNARQYRIHVGMYYQDAWDPTGQMKPVYFLDDFRIFSGAGAPA